MELIENFRSEYYGADNFLYRFENGLKVLVTHKKESEEIYAAILFKCGSIAEHQISVTNGTLHFLEHLMINSPCELFPTAEEKRLFRHGDSAKPGLIPNGTTGPNYMSLYASSHFKGRERVMKLLEGYLQPEREDFLKEIEKERQIIISEAGRRPNIELDSYYQFLTFIFKDIFPEMVRLTSGDIEDIQKITIDELVKARTELMKAENAVIVIQTNTWPDRELEKDIEKLSKYFSKDKSSITYPFKAFEDKFAIGYMNDPKVQNIVLDFNTLFMTQKSDSDRTIVLNKFARAFGSWSLYEYLRQKNELVYEVDVFRSLYFGRYEDKGFQTKCPFRKLPEVLDAIDDMYAHVWHNMLYSEKGTSWLEGAKSDYIFKKTVSYSLDFPVDLGLDILREDNFRPSFTKQVSVAKTITKQDVEHYFNQEYLVRPMKVWIKSSLDEDEVLDVFKASRLYKRLSKQ